MTSEKINYISSLSAVKIWKLKNITAIVLKIEPIQAKSDQINARYIESLNRKVGIVPEHS